MFMSYDKWETYVGIVDWKYFNSEFGNSLKNIVRHAENDRHREEKRVGRENIYLCDYTNWLIIFTKTRHG